VAAILRQHTLVDLRDITPGDKPCWIVLSQVRTPGNFGTLLRTAAAIGAAGFILVGNTIDPFDPAVVRASMGAFFGQTLVRVGKVEELRQWTQRHHLLVVGASPDGTLAYNQIQYTRPTVLMLGEERRGLTTEQRAICQQLVRIPMVDGTDSLNLGVAGSLLMYEVLRSENPTM
jgi:TrmH family RNA methyltransferase